jgi:hypothetical protein
MKMTLVLDNIRSTYNVGAILRTADGFGVSKVILSGYTPRVHDMNLLPHLREKLDHEIHKTALGAEDMLDIYSCDDIKSELVKLREQGWQIVGLENNIQNVPLFQSNDPKLEEVLSDKVVLILGEEVKCQGVRTRLHETEGFVGVVDHEDGEQGTEDFFLHDGVVGRHVVQDGGRDAERFGLAFASHHDLGGIDEAAEAVEMAAVDDFTVVGIVQGAFAI